MQKYNETWFSASYTVFVEKNSVSKPIRPKLHTDTFISGSLSEFLFPVGKVTFVDFQTCAFTVLEKLLLWKISALSVGSYLPKITFIFSTKHAFTMCSLS